MSSHRPTPPSDLLGAYLAGADAARSPAPLPHTPPPVVPPNPPRRPTAVWIAVGVLALACAGLAGALIAGRTEAEPAPVAAVAPQMPPAYTPAAAPAPPPVAQPASGTLPPGIGEIEEEEFEDESDMSPYTSTTMPSGTWFVVLGGARGAPDARMLRAEDMLRGNGVNVQQIASDDYPGLNPGLVVLVEGPTTQAAARARLRLLKDLVPGAYVKSGW